MTVDFEIRERFPQLLVLDLEGPAVPKLEGNIARDHDDEIPDLITLWVRAMNLGMFAGPGLPPAQCGARIIERGPAYDGDKQRYHLAVRACDPGAVRVLGNLLDNLALTARVYAESMSSTLPRFDPTACDYTPAPDELPFAFELDAESGTQVAIELVDELADPIVDKITEALEIWSVLVAAGGWKFRGKHDRLLGAMPDDVLQLDSHTIIAGFTELFRADSAAFHPIGYYALGLHESGVRVARVTVS